MLLILACLFSAIISSLPLADVIVRCLTLLLAAALMFGRCSYLEGFAGRPANVLRWHIAASEDVQWSFSSRFDTSINTLKDRSVDWLHFAIQV